MQDGADIRNLPIDIAFARLGEWLVDRKRIPRDWRKRLSSIKSRISSALSSLPRDLDPFFQTLDLEGLGYLEVKQVYKILLSCTSESRNIFGRLSGSAGEWESIVRSFEKDHIFLGEAAQIMVQNVNYEIPYLKRQMQKVEHQLIELDRKEADIKRNVALSAAKYSEACQELGLQGENVRLELLEATKILPSIFSEILQVLNNDSILKAMNYYQDFVRDVHTEKEKIPGVVLQNLGRLHENPPSVHVSMSAEVQNSLSDMSRTDVGHFQTGEPMDADLSMGGIDWNISVDDTQIDWDIGTVEQVEESDHGFGSYELVDYSADYQESENRKDMLVDEASLKTAEKAAVVPADSGSGICWDAGFEKSQFATLEDSIAPDAGVESQQIAVEKSQPSVLDEERSPFLETEYRNKILDDLFEVKSFLNQRLVEMTSEESSSLQQHVQAVAPPVLQQYSVDAIQLMISQLSLCISMLTGRKMRDLIMTLNSKWFLDKLVLALEEKKQHEVKLRESLNDLPIRRVELQNTLSSSWPKLVALIPFITAGDPDLSTTSEALKILDSSGSDLIELGIPYSDPLADGPVIQAAATRALKNGTNFDGVISMLREVVPQLSCPISLFTYYNPILKRGVEKFMSIIGEVGVHGLVVPDVPLEENESLRKEAIKHNIELVLLSTPTTPPQRMKEIARASEGFIYLVATVGVTGARQSVNSRVQSLLQEIKETTPKPVAVGFGISKPEHVKQVAEWGADGVIVGSAFVKLLGEAKSSKEGLKELETFTRSLKAALP